MYDLIKKLEALEAKATKGPWKRFYAQRSPHDIIEIRDSFNDKHNPVISYSGFDGLRRNKKEIIANAALLLELRNNLPSIIAALRAQEASNAGR